MKLFRHDAIALPDRAEGWTSAPIGFSLGEMRVLSYVSIALFFVVNGAGFWLLGPAYLDGFTAFLARHSAFAAVAYAIGAMLSYYALHEALHVVFQPDRGLSDRTLLGMKAAAVFVIYNGQIGKRDLERVVLAPFLVLTPVCLLACAATWLEVAPFSPVFLANLCGLHLCACAGDLLLFRKLRKAADFSWLWNAYSSAWVR